MGVCPFYTLHWWVFHRCISGISTNINLPGTCRVDSWSWMNLRYVTIHPLWCIKFRWEHWKHFALRDLATNDEERSLIIGLTQKIRKRKLCRTDRGSRTSSGSALRCDGDFLGNEKMSSSFISVPYVLPESFGCEEGKTHGLLLPQRLHQACSPFESTTQLDRDQAFRKYEGRQQNQVLWVHEVYILVLDSGKASPHMWRNKKWLLTGFLTYGQMSQESLQGDSIEMVMEERLAGNRERLIQFRDLERRLSYFTLDKCQTFYVSHSSLMLAISK
jgi:hypothetical protein